MPRVSKAWRAVIAMFLLIFNSQTWTVISKASDLQFIVKSVQEAWPYFWGVFRNWGWLGGVALLLWVARDSWKAPANDLGKRQEHDGAEVTAGIEQRRILEEYPKVVAERDALMQEVIKAQLTADTEPTERPSRAILGPQFVGPTATGPVSLSWRPGGNLESPQGLHLNAENLTSETIRDFRLLISDLKWQRSNGDFVEDEDLGQFVELLLHGPKELYSEKPKQYDFVRLVLAERLEFQGHLKNEPMQQKRIHRHGVWRAKFRAKYRGEESQSWTLHFRWERDKAPEGIEWPIA